MENKETDIWMRMYEEQMNQGRHHESLRAQSTNIIVAISAAILAFLSSDNEGCVFLAELSILLIIINIYGLLMSLKHYERNRLHVTLGRAYRDVISKFTPIDDFTINETNKMGRDKHKAAFKMTSKMRAYILWSGLHIALAFLGILFLI